VNEHKFLNQFQPQTLVIATLLLYIDAFFNLISFNALLVLIAVLGAAGGYGIANEKRWGYLLAVSAAGLNLLLYIALFGSEIISNVSLLVSFVFDVALVLLLVHPMSRDYERIWFK